MSTRKFSYRPYILVLILIVILAIFIDRIIASKEERENQIFLDNKILDTYSGMDIETFVKANFQNVFAVKALYENSKEVTEKTFQGFCSRLIDRNNYIHAIEYITPDLVIQRVSPIKGNRKVLGLDLKKDPDITARTAKKSLEQFRQGKDPAVMSDPSRLHQGFRGIVLLTTLVENGEVSGFVGAVINIDLLVASLREREIRSGVDFSLKIGTKWLQKISGKKLYREQRFDIFGKKIIIGAGITKPLISYKRLLVIYSWITLIIGLVLFFRYLDRESKRLMSELSVISKERSNLQMLMEKILDTSRLGVAVLDRAGGVIMHNKHFKFFLNEDEQIIGKNFFEQDIPESIKKHCKSIIESNKEQVASVEVAVKKDERIIWYNCLICCPRVDENKYCYLITQDISIQKKLLQDRFEQQKMETVGQLAAGIAHDFNNILSASSGYLEVVQQKIESGEITEASLYMQNIERMNERAAGLVSKLLGYAKRGKTEAVIIDLKEILTTLVDMARDTFPKTIEIKSSLPLEGLPVIGDVNQIESAFLNILINARDSIVDSGTIKISGEIKSLSEMKATLGNAPTSGRYIEITINDTGHGMPPDVLDRIFEPFFSTKRDTGGSGLGLSMCYGIFKSHGGYIFGDSVEGKGSTFTVYLPLIDNGDQEPPVVKETPSRKEITKLNILVIDDEEDIVKFLHEAIKARGHNIMSATTCLEGVETFKANRDSIDAILIDYAMPKMTGFECAEMLREIRKDVKIIMISGYTEEKLIDPEIRKGTIDGFLKKPFRLHELFEMLEEGK